MREIKFRGKSADEWVYGDLWQYNGLTWIVAVIDGEAQRFPVDPATVGQYTGWQDDTKKDVYEGDKAINLITGDIHEVVWDSDGSQFSFAGKHDWYDFYELDDRYGSPNNCLRVIGNRWDTP